MGTVIRNRDGHVLASKTQKVYHAYSPIMMEAMAAMDGLQLTSNMGYTHEVFEGDCL